jgi:hypothetical protein
MDLRSESPPASLDRACFPASFQTFLASWGGRLLLLIILAGLSLPASFTGKIGVGLDSSWELSLQQAAAGGKVFGRDIVFTYGPLGWLLFRVGVSKLPLLLYDLFITGSLLSIYKGLLPARPRPLEAIFVIAVALVTKLALLAAPSAVLFTILCYWLWRTYDSGSNLAVIWSLACAVVLFFGKVNYGLLMMGLIPGYGGGLMVLCKSRRVPGLLLFGAFPLLLLLGSAIWHVDLRGYFRSGLELVSGYNDAMVTPPAKTLVRFQLALLFMLAMAVLAVCGRHRLDLPGQIMILPILGLDCFLLFKNGFVRFDEIHARSFEDGLPLLLALWCIAWRSHKGAKGLLFASVVYPLALLVGTTPKFGREELFASTPQNYLRQAFDMPRRQDSQELQSVLRASFPEMVLPDDVRATIGRASVDVMPWESSIAIVNGLALKQRPVPQSYSVFTPYLDNLNASFLSSVEAPDFIIYARAQYATIDARPSAWDESITKRALLENYVFASQFTMPLRVGEVQKLEPASVFIMKRVPGTSRLAAVSTNEVKLTLNQKLRIPVTSNVLFLTLNVDRTFLGRMKGFALAPSLLTATFEYEDGSSTNFRAVLPILKTGVLVNRRVESSDEIRNWLQLAPEQNIAVSSISFKSSSAWPFKPELRGSLVECRIIQNTNVDLAGATLKP